MSDHPPASWWQVESAYVACVGRYVDSGSMGSLRLVGAVLDLLYWVKPPMFGIQGA